MTGQNEADAKSWLESRGLVTSIVKANKPGIVSGYVRSQDVPEGTKVDQDTTITLKVQP